MMIKKSMISAVTAAVLVTGFTGCSSDTTNVTEGAAASPSTSTSTSTTGGQNDRISNPKVTVTGTVQDTNGNPLNNVTVYVMGMETTTDAGGVYVFNDVPTINTANNGNLNFAGARIGAINETINGALQVTIAAPAGYLGASVMVTPESQQISSGDPAVLNGGQTNPNTNFIDGYVASAGTAVLPMLSGTVHGVLENVLNGTRPVGVEVCLDLTQTSFDALHNSTATPMGDVSYATPKFCDTTEEGGVFDIENAPVDAQLAYNLAHWNLAAGQAINVVVEDTVVTNIGELRVVPIVTADTIPPVVASVVEGLNINTNATARMMLVDDARSEFTLNFSEAINVDSDGSDLPDTDMTDSVNVYVGTTPATMQRVNATAVYNGNQLTVALPDMLTDGQLIDIHLVNADFRDMSNNFLTLNGNIGYDAASSNVTTIVMLQAFNDLNLNAPTVTSQAQMEKDVAGTATDGLNTTRAYSNAFNDADLATGFIQQLNAPEAQLKLNILSVAQNNGAVLASVNTARITFTPSTATGYIITVTRNSIPRNVNISATIGSNVNVRNNNLGGNGTQNVYIEAADENMDIELVLGALADINIDDIVTITPVDDLGYFGTPSSITLEDNVAPTTKTQPSYMRIFNSAGTDAGVTVAPFGDGGELANGFGRAEIGTPILGVTPGLLDNLDAAGNNILDANEFVVGDETLRHELEVHTGKFNPADAAPVITTARVYDATAWTVFSGNLDRRLGASFTENIDLTGVTPTFTGSGIDMNSFAAVNDVILNDSGNSYQFVFGPDYNNDLATFTTGDVIALANSNHGEVLSFDGIKDANGNVADNAKVIIQDRMPAFMTKSFYDGDLVMEFNEPIMAPTDADSVTLVLQNGTRTDTAMIILDATTQMTGAVTNWELSADAKTLTVYATGLPANTFGGNTLKSLFDAGEYVETAYDATSREHALLMYPNVRDTHAYVNTNGNLVHNSWINWRNDDGVGIDADLRMLTFAPIDMIGLFSKTVLNDGFVAGDDASAITQIIQWSFTHPIEVDAGSLFDFSAPTAGVTANADGSGTADDVRLGNVYNGGAGAPNIELALCPATANHVGTGSFTGSPIDLAGTRMLLSADHKLITLEFRTNAGACIVESGDLVRFSGSIATPSEIVSALDPAQNELDLTANAD